MRIYFKLFITLIAVFQSSFYPTLVGIAANGQTLEFRELQIAAVPLKAALEIALLRKPESYGELQGGLMGIPENILADSGTHGREVENGQIIVTWKSDGSQYAGHTYILTLTELVYPAFWAESGSCFIMGFCTSLGEQNAN